MPSKGQTTDIMYRLWKKTVKEGDCCIWTGKIVRSGHGIGKEYGCIWYEGKTVRIGRLICHLISGADMDDNTWTANHKPECKSSLCWNPTHLYIGTQADNVRDSIKAGTFNYGTNNLNGGSNYNKFLADFMRRGPRK